MKIGLLGLGTVGRAVVEALRENRERIEARAGVSLEIVRALVRDPGKHLGDGELVTLDADAILEDPEVAIVVEVMGGMEPARTYMLKALARGKAVVTANKEVLANAQAELLAAAQAGKADLLFEASVGAGVPLIRGINMGLAANRVRRVLGILNGTTNFILTAMTNQGQTFAEALQEAKTRGYAEADPTADIEAYDAARKIAILASIAFGSPVQEKDVFREGIGDMDFADVAAGRSFGWRLKQVAQAREVGGALDVRVTPVFLPEGHPLAAVEGVYNAVMVEALPLGETMFYGPGAGGPSTASAILADVIEAARNIRLGGRAFTIDHYRSLPILPPEEATSAFYLRLVVADRPGVLAQVAGIFGRHDVSMRAVHQRPLEDGAELVVITHPAREGNFFAALGALREQPAVISLGRAIRIEGGQLP